MTNKQAYAGLLERLVAKRIVGEPDKQGLHRVLDAEPVCIEAAEAISSLLKALEFYAEQWEQDVDAERTLSGWEGTIGEVLPTRALLDDFGQRARAALNSDAPLSIGEGDRG